MPTDQQRDYLQRRRLDAVFCACASLPAILLTVHRRKMPSVPEELNVFRRPHGHMMKLVKDIEREVGRWGVTRPVVVDR